MSYRSQNAQILSYLKEGGRLTGKKALILFGTMDLRKRISEISQLHPIHKEWIVIGKKRVKEYTYGN